MKIVKLMILTLLIGAATVSCKKEVVGPQGAQGAKGADGNANVTVHRYGATTFTNSNYYWESFFPSGLTSAMVSNSVILTYYALSNSNIWYTVGSDGPGGSGYSTRQYCFVNDKSVEIRLNNPDGTTYSGPGDVVWDSVKIYVIPATSLAIAQDNNLNLDDYKAVSKYFAVK